MILSFRLLHLVSISSNIKISCCVSNTYISFDFFTCFKIKFNYRLATCVYSVSESIETIS